MSSCNGSKKNLIFYACSCGANVGEVADRAAREFVSQGLGSMPSASCFAAGMQGKIKQALDADMNIVFDGCAADCCKKALEAIGATKIKQFRVTDMGVARVNGARATDVDVKKIVDAAEKEISKI